MAFDFHEHFQKPYERWLEKMSCDPDDLGYLDEEFKRRLERYMKKQRESKGWICEYCGSTQPPMDSHCRECGAPRNK